MQKYVLLLFLTFCVQSANANPTFRWEVIGSSFFIFADNSGQNPYLCSFNFALLYTQYGDQGIENVSRSSLTPANASNWTAVHVQTPWANLRLRSEPTIGCERREAFRPPRAPAPTPNRPPLREPTQSPQPPPPLRRETQMHEHLMWCVWHEGVPLWSGDSLRDLTVVRDECATKQRRPVRGWISSLSSDQIRNIIEIYHAEFIRKTQVEVHFKWTLNNRGLRIRFQNLKEQQNFAEIRRVYVEAQRHNPQARYLLSLLRDSDIGSMIN